MKRLKRVSTLLMVLAMLLAMATAAFAENPKTNITIDGIGTNSTYKAFKLLDSTNAGEKYAYTVNEKYETILKQVIVESNTTDEITSVDQVTTDAIIPYIRAQSSDTAIRAFADAVFAKLIPANADYTLDSGNEFTQEVEQGYYLIAETAMTTPSNPGTDVFSLVMLDTAGESDTTITINTKEDLPEVWKKVKDNEIHTNAQSPEWKDSADYAVGTNISYQLTGTVSDHIADYDSYYYQFTDTMTHLDFVGISKVYLINTVKVGNQEIPVVGEIVNPEAPTAPYYTVNTPAAGSDPQVLTVTFNDLKRVMAKVNGQPDISVDSTSQIVVEYTAKLNSHAVMGTEGNANTVTLTYNNNPYYVSGGSDEPTNNTTPPDKNIVFTYKFVVDKVDENGDGLPGAGFTLYKWDPAIGASGDWASVRAINTDGANTTINQFSFERLDAGKYKLVESHVPAGYNKADDIEFEIRATHVLDAATPTLTALEVYQNSTLVSGAADSGAAFIVNMTTGTITKPVVNTTGTELPETGGMGTTLFYVLGGFLTIGAALLLVTKLRVRREG